MELIDLVNSVIIFLSQMVNFPSWILDCDSHSPAFLDLFISSDVSICSAMAFPAVGNSDHVVVSVSIYFPTNSKRNTSFHYIAYDYCHADWDSLRDHLRDVPWEDIFKFSTSAAASDFVREFRWNWYIYIYISLIVSIRSNLTITMIFSCLWCCCCS